MLWPQGKGEVEIQTSNLCFMRQSQANCATPWGLYKNYILNIGITKSTTECISQVPRIQDHSNNYLKNIDFSSITRYPFHLTCNCNTTSILPIVSIKGNIPSKQSTTFNKLFFHPNNHAPYALGDTCYNGRDKGLRSHEGELTPKTHPQFRL